MIIPKRLSERLSSSDDPTTVARHLLRALLREASYLPDSTCRSFVHHRIIARFRDYPEGHPFLEERFGDVISQGLKHLRQFQRANNGQLRALTRILEHSYGRAGKRRYELMKPLLIEHSLVRDEGQADPTARHDDLFQQPGPPIPLPRALEGPYKTKQDMLKFVISDRFPLLQALVHSQSRQTARFYEDRHIKSPFFQMPRVNLWQRTQPRKRQANAAKKWYAETLDKVLPPLPEEEWTQLRHLALGETPWTGPPRKQPASRSQRLAVADPVETPHTELLRQEYEAADAGAVRAATLLERELGIRYKKRRTRDEGKDVGHVVTPRLMQRLYSKVLINCPLMTYDATKAAWTVTWFDPKREQDHPPESQSPAAPAVSASDDRLEAWPAGEVSTSLFGAQGVHRMAQKR